MDYKAEAIKVLKDLAKTYPNQTLASHITLALEDYSKDTWVSDKEFYFAIEKYRCEKELDTPHMEPQDEIDEIYKDGMNLSIEDLLEDEEDYGS